MRADELERRLSQFPRMRMGHLPTPVEALPRLGDQLGIDLSVKRDDCTGIAFGGNKVRQLAYYLGAARKARADVVLITGAVQSNFVRTTAAMAAQMGIACHVQLEERVPDVSTLHRSNGNVLLDHLFGATVHTYPDGEDEAGADRAMRDLADRLRSEGHVPYVIPLGADSPPLGALGYVEAAVELSRQLEETGRVVETVFVASGSALTHAGLLLGLGLIGSPVVVQGVCVRRAQDLQIARVSQRVADTAALMGIASPIAESDIHVTDQALAPGYGQVSDKTRAALTRTARAEGLLLDPVYTAKVMAGLIGMAEAGQLADRRVLFWHTGGQPALFGYADQLG